MYRLPTLAIDDICNQTLNMKLDVSLDIYESTRHFHAESWRSVNLAELVDNIYLSSKLSGHLSNVTINGKTYESIRVEFSNWKAENGKPIVLYSCPRYNETLTDAARKKLHTLYDDKIIAARDVGLKTLQDETVIYLRDITLNQYNIISQNLAKLKTEMCNVFGYNIPFEKE